MVKIRIIPPGVVPTGCCAIEHQAEALGCACGGGVVHVARLTCKGVQRHLVGGCGAGTGRPRGAGLAPGLVAQLQNFRAVGIRGQAGAAQLVTEQVFHAHVLRDGVLAHGDAGCPCQVVLGDLAAVLDLVVRAHEEDCITAHHGLDPFAVRIEGEGGHHHVVFLHFHQAVFGIIAQKEGVCANDARDLVAVGVVLVGVAVRKIGYSVPVGESAIGVVRRVRHSRGTGQFRIGPTQPAVVQPAALIRAQDALVQGYLVHAAVEHVGRIPIRADGQRVGAVHSPAAVADRIHRSVIDLDSVGVLK